MAIRKRNTLNRPKEIKTSRFRLLKTPKGVVAIAFVLTFAAIGGYKIYKSQAASYTYLGTSSGVRITACKTYTTAYGGVYNVNIYYAKAKGSIYGYMYGAATLRNGKYLPGPGLSNLYYNGQVGSRSISASRLYNDRITASVAGPYVTSWTSLPNSGAWISSPKNPATFANC